jgi:hypothetical protein
LADTVVPIENQRNRDHGFNGATNSDFSSPTVAAGESSGLCSIEAGRTPPLFGGGLISGLIAGDELSANVRGGDGDAFDCRFRGGALYGGMSVAEALV